MLGKGSHADCQLYDSLLGLDAAFRPPPFRLALPAV